MPNKTTTAGAGLAGFAHSVKSAWILLPLLALAIIAIYSPSLRAPFIFDDQGKIVENTDIRSLSDIGTKLVFRYRERKWESNDPSRPVTYLTFALNYHFGELDPLGYHWVNLILHTLNTFLLFFLVRKILFYSYQKDHLFFPLAAAVLFAVHPINSVVVCYTYNRSGALAFFFFLSSILLFIRADNGRRFTVPLSILCFVIALFSKPDAITLPAVLLALDFIFLSDYDISKMAARGLSHLAFWTVLTAYLLFRYFYLGGLGDLEASNSLNDWPRFLYLAVQPYVIVKYLRLLLLPKGLCFEHSITQPGTLLQSKFAVSYLILAGMALAGWLAYKRKTAGSKIILFAILWFLIILAPTSSLFPTTLPMEENRVYMSGLGFYLAAVLACHAFFKINLSAGGIPFYKRPSGLLMSALLGTYIFGLAAVTIKRSRLYREPALVWDEAHELYPLNVRATANASVAHNNLAVAYYQQNKYDKALEELQKAIVVDPNSAMAHDNLGRVLYERKDYPGALREFETVLRLDPNNAFTRQNIALIRKAQQIKK